MVLMYFALFESATMIPLVVCEGKHHELEMRFEIDVPKKYCGRILYPSVPPSVPYHPTGGIITIKGESIPGCEKSIFGSGERQAHYASMQPPGT